MSVLFARIAPGVMILAIVIATELAHQYDVAHARGKIRGWWPGGW